jgi:hypothetical protein
MTGTGPSQSAWATQGQRGRVRLAGQLGLTSIPDAGCSRGELIGAGLLTIW